jgi:hypothetical protein
MTREQFAEKIGWSRIMWVLGFVNIAGMSPALYEVITTWKSQPVGALQSFGIFLVVQIGFGLNGYIRRDNAMVAAMIVCAILNATTIGLSLFIRHFG